MENPDHESTDSDYDSESDQDQAIKSSEPSKTAIFNKDGLLDKLGDISFPGNVDWIQKLSFDVDQGESVDVNDDLSRELAFFTQGLNGTREAFTKFQSLGIPFLRPGDYYAEMVKSDTHMVKVKGRLLAEKKRIEEAEERKKARESKKIAKEVQAQKMKERVKKKKEDIESVKKWRKQRKDSGFADNSSSKDGGGGDEMGFKFEEGSGFSRSNKKKQQWVAPGDRSGGKSGKGGKKEFEKKRNGRDHKNSKFGFGGKKGLKKQNTAETTNDIRGFNNNSSSGQKRKR